MGLGCWYIKCRLVQAHTASKALKAYTLIEVLIWSLLLGVTMSNKDNATKKRSVFCKSSLGNWLSKAINEMTQRLKANLSQREAIRMMLELIPSMKKNCSKVLDKGLAWS